MWSVKYDVMSGWRFLSGNLRIEDGEVRLKYAYIFTLFLYLCACYALQYV